MACRGMRDESTQVGKTIKALQKYSLRWQQEISNIHRGLPKASFEYVWEAWRNQGDMENPRE